MTNFLDRVHNLEQEVLRMKTSQSMGSSDVPQSFSYKINISQTISRAYGQGYVAIKFTSNSQISPLICFRGSVNVHGIEADVKTANAKAAVSYELGSSMVLYYEAGGTIDTSPNTTYCLIEWSENQGQMGTTIIDGVLYTSSDGKIDVRSNVY